MLFVIIGLQESLDVVIFMMTDMFVGPNHLYMFIYVESIIS